MTGLSLWQAQKTGAGTNEHDEWLHRLQHWHLSPISYVDCLAFCLFLAAGLLKQIGLVRTVWTVLWTLPFLREHSLLGGSRYGTAADWHQWSGCRCPISGPDSAVAASTRLRSSSTSYSDA